MNSFIVSFWAKVFEVLGKVSLFSFIRSFDGIKVSYMFVEIWVLFNLFLALISPFIVSKNLDSVLATILVAYGILRSFEIIIYQANVLLFDQYRSDKKRYELINKYKELPKYYGKSVDEIIALNEKCEDEKEEKIPPVYALRSYRRLVILLIHNYFEIIFWFASGYLFYASNFQMAFDNANVFESIYSSFVTMTTFGEKLIKPSTSFGAMILFTQSLFGLLLTIVSLARFISILPDIKSKDEFETY